MKRMYPIAMTVENTSDRRKARGPAHSTVQRAEIVLAKVLELPGKTAAVYARELGKDTSYVYPALTYLQRTGKIEHRHYDGAHRYDPIMPSSDTAQPE